ncbi:hypothetical protein Taro_011739 [Colocasia esculenta]|uniref:Uncharacterized protein n=1 Tax=Colocasia esculenta TaxID=4460 RepID=A0A843U765_COLES|nr:hypothetical protein [Colocasia esculenta]
MGRHSTGEGTLFSPRLHHSARLATDLSVRVSPHRAHSAGFVGQVGSSFAHRPSAPHKDSWAWLSRLRQSRSASTVTSAVADLFYYSSNIGAVCGNRYLRSVRFPLSYPQQNSSKHRQRNSP